MTVRPPLAQQVARVAFALALLYFLYLIRTILLPFFLAFFFAYLMEPLVMALQRRGAPRSLAILTIFAVTAILIAVLVAVVVPILAVDLEKAARAIPDYLGRLRILTTHMTRIYNRLHLPPNVRLVVDRLTAQTAANLGRSLGTAITSLLRVLPESAVLLVVPFIAYYISRDYRRAADTLTRRLKNRPDLLAKVLAIDRVLKAYFRMQALELLIVTILLTIGLILLKLDFALLLGLIAGILNVIPYFGPLLGVLPAALLALTHSPWHALYVILLFAVVNQLEASLLVPRLVGGQVGLHPLLVIFALLVGGKFFGLLGMLIAVPVTAAVKVVTDEYLRSVVTADPDLTSSGASGMMKETEPGAPKSPDDSG